MYQIYCKSLRNLVRVRILLFSLEASKFPYRSDTISCYYKYVNSKPVALYQTVTINANDRPNNWLKLQLHRLFK